MPVEPKEEDSFEEVVEAEIMQEPEKPKEEEKPKEPEKPKEEEKPVSELRSRRAPALERFRNAGKQVAERVRKGDFNSVMEAAQNIDLLMWNPVWKSAAAVVAYLFAWFLFYYISAINFTKLSCEFLLFFLVATGVLNAMGVLEYVPFIKPSDTWFSKEQVDSVVKLASTALNEVYMQVVDIALWKDWKRTLMVFGGLEVARQYLVAIPWATIFFIAGLSLFFVPFFMAPPKHAHPKVVEASKLFKKHAGEKGKRFYDVVKNAIEKIPKYVEEQ